ncbi:MAG: hypothetical protein K5905_30975, partial [Roseibium sp.]|uniref:hypothetical protein n=1 Tax=Roseibium sp. TaxID=1936156 RepID=UPI0026358353
HHHRVQGPALECCWREMCPGHHKKKTCRAAYVQSEVTNVIFLSRSKVHLLSILNGVLTGLGRTP